MAQRRYDVVAFGLLFLSLVGYFSYGYVRSYWRQVQAARSYRAVPAVVVSADVAERGSSATTRGTSYMPRIVTRYDTAGQSYESDRYFFTGTGWRDRASAQDVVARYPVGSVVEVYVDPDDPRSAILDRTPPDSRAAWPLVALILFPLGLIVYGLGLGRRHQ